MKKILTKNSLLSQRPPKSQSFQRSTTNLQPFITNKNTCQTTVMQPKHLSNEDDEIHGENARIKLPVLKRQHSIQKQSISSQNCEFNGLTNRVSEIKYPFFRTKSKKQCIMPFQTVIKVSGQNRRLIQSFLRKLSIVEAHALKSQQISKEYIELIYNLNRKQAEYTEIISRRQKILRTAQEQQILHSSAENEKLRVDLAEDQRTVRSFALKWHIPLHRKYLLSQSLEMRSNRHAIAETKSLSKSKKKAELQNSSNDNYQAQQLESVTSPIRVIDEVNTVGAKDIFLSLKNNKKQSLTQKQRNKLGISYLNKIRHSLKDSETTKGGRAKISLIKEVMHHWAVDNRFLEVYTKTNQLEDEGFRASRHYNPPNSIKKHKDFHKDKSI